MNLFIDKYIPDEELFVLDLGSRIIPRQSHLGSYRQLFNNKKWRYTGVDVERGENVDVVILDPYIFPFGDGEFDIVISGQTLEHIEYPWLWFEEMARVLKKGGICCIIAPSIIQEHKFPIDTYRYYPDGMRALAKWGGLDVLETARVTANARMEDCYLVARKP